MALVLPVTMGTVRLADSAGCVAKIRTVLQMLYGF